MTSMSDLLGAGLLKSGEDLIWYRRTSGQTYRAVVNNDGSLTTGDGVKHRTPSGAAKHFSNKPIDGWNCWKIENSGVTLVELRTLFQSS